ncbi:uncharacterized protein H6S33_000376 [Morchella sextelata]|uniref:uncharacterized protein n=1 Tax=Morchella sextelata TaxID=1174677 RepID=UPI001D046792|nr:uncharacterized protein H6S33_000376 [Morchella sextelata]KAH0614740.1 hypothetical protein H6S33_000376 [Morchella sextelata]
MNTTPSSTFLEMGSASDGASSWPALRSSQTYPAVAQQQQQNPAYFLTQEQQKVVDTDIRVGELMQVIAYGGTGKTICLAEYAKKRPRKRFLYVTSSSIAALNAEKRFPGNITCKPIGKPLKERRHDYELEEMISVLGMDEGKIGSALVNPQMHLQLGTSHGREQTEMKKIPSVKEVALMVQRVRMGEALWNAMLNTKYLPHDAYTKILQLKGGLPDGSTIGQGDVDTLAFGEYDIIIWDRAQYLSGSVVEIFLRQRLRAGLIILGDPYQRIHGPERKKDEASDTEAYKPTSCQLLLGYLGEDTAINGVRKHDSPGPTENGGSGKYTVIFRRDADLIDYVIEYYFLKVLELCEKMVLDDSYKETEADVIFITVHKAKGLTWNRVFVPDSVLRYRFNLSAENLNKNQRYWFSRDKMSLLYVAVTRAKKELIIGKGIASWLVAKMGLYRFYLSPIQGNGACPSCHDYRIEQHGTVNWEARPKREGVVIGWEYLLPQKSFGVTADSYGNSLPQGPRKEAVACDICAKGWNRMARAAHMELKKFANPITRALDGPDSAMNQIIVPNMRWWPARAPAGRQNSRLFKTMYKMQIEMVQDCDETPYMHVMPTRTRRL